MGIFKKINFFLLRVSLGWVMFYAGITKILDPKWTAKGYIAGAKMFPTFYGSLLTNPTNLMIIDFLNKWGLTLIGVSLMLGFLVRFSSPFGAALMMLYYFPVLDFPYASGKNYYIVDFHIIFALTFIVLLIGDAGKYWGLDYYRAKAKLR